MTDSASMGTYMKILGELENVAGKIDESLLQGMIAKIQDANRIFCVGAGRSGIVLSAFCMRLNHLGLQAFMAGGIPCPGAGKGDLLVAASSSGKTPGIVAVLAQGKSAGARIVAFTTTEEGGRNLGADLPLIIPAPSALVNTDNRVSVQSMKSLFEQTVFLLCETIVCVLKERMAVSDVDMAARHANLE